jgi:PTS system nitrogen regulatory IIA component
MDFRNVLTPSCTRVLTSVSSKKRLLESLSERIAEAHPGVDARQLFDQLMVRERLGSTGLGEGVAIPHCRQSGRIEPVGAFVALAAPVDFDAPDGRGVDLVFVLVVPEHASSLHLQMLARLAEVFGDEANRQALRACATDEALYDALVTLLEGT